jgi:hypothetical protein
MSTMVGPNKDRSPFWFLKTALLAGGNHRTRQDAGRG